MAQGKTQMSNAFRLAEGLELDPSDEIGPLHFAEIVANFREFESSIYACADRQERPRERYEPVIQRRHDSARSAIVMLLSAWDGYSPLPN